MPRGDNSAYTEKQTRQAEHIEESEKERGRSNADSERIAWATVNKESGGGHLSGTGRAHTNGTVAKGGDTSNGAVRSREERSEAAKRGWSTRRSKDALK